MRISMLAAGLCLAAVMPLLAQEQIVIPDDGTGMPGADGPPPLAGSTEFVMKPVTVQDQNQLRGRYGSAWAEGEVKQRAAVTCAEAGMRLIYFKPGAKDKKGRTEFAAVCK